MFVIIDIAIYVKIMNGMAKQFSTKSNTMLISRKLNLILLSCHEKFLNLSENIGSSLTKRMPIMTEPMQTNHGLVKKFAIAE